jgi:hypothetical protein
MASQDDWKAMLVYAGLVGLLLLAMWAAISSGEKWEQFKLDHKCKIVAQVDGEIFNTVSVGGNGQMQIGIGSTPDKTGWLCDDGVTYYK